MELGTMENDLISIIVPIYNVDKYLDRCVKSILSQSYRNIEVILIDDGSTDSSLSICNSFTDNRIRIIHKNNGGLGSARNAGLEVFRGKYVTFIDGDDAIQSDHINNIYNCLVENKADTCICGHTKVFANDQTTNRNYLSGNVYRSNEILTQVLSRMMGSIPGKYDKIEMSVCMALFSADIINEKKIRFHSEREFISEDLIFDFDYYPHSKVVAVSDDVGYLYYDNQGSLTTKYNPNRFDLQKILTLEEIGRSKSLEILDNCRLRIYNTFMGIARYSIKLEVKFSDINGKQMTRANIRRIINDPMVKEALEAIKNENVPRKSRIVNHMISRGWVTALMLTMKMKNKYNI